MAAPKDVAIPITSRVSNASGSFENLMSPQSSEEFGFINHSDTFVHIPSAMQQSFHKTPDSDDFSPATSPFSNSMPSQSGLSHEEDGDLRDIATNKSLVWKVETPWDASFNHDGSDEESSDCNDRPPVSNGNRYHMTCLNCRIQMGICIKQESDERCQNCRNRNLACTFDSPLEQSELLSSDWDQIKDHKDLFGVTNPIDKGESSSTEDLLQKYPKHEEISYVWVPSKTNADEAPGSLSDDAPILNFRGRPPTKSQARIMEDDPAGQEITTLVNHKRPKHRQSRLGSLGSDASASQSSFHSSRSISLPPQEVELLYKGRTAPQNDLPGYLAEPLPSRAYLSYQRPKYAVDQGPSKGRNHFLDDFSSPSRSDLSYSPSFPPPAVDDTPTASLVLPSSSVPLDLFIPIGRIDRKAVANGGFASIHIAISSGTKVAVKLIRVDQENERVARRRLTREVILWRQLNHPNITPLLGIAKYPELSDLELIVTPWYDKGSLAIYLSSDSHPFDERLQLSLGVVAGLSYLHGRNPVMVHGDLKPSNILLDDAGQPRLCDFGLARIINEAHSGLTTTTAHSATPLYIAPELLNGEQNAPPWDPTTASDVYSLGSVLYKLLTGNAPYAHLSINPQIYAAIIKGQKPGTIPKSIAEEKDRFQWELFEACWSEPEKRPDVLAVRDQLLKVNQSWISRNNINHWIEENGVLVSNAPPSSSFQRYPRITHLYPASGSTFGGIEVTLLGENFSEALLKDAGIAFGENVVWFGPGVESAQVRSDTVLVCTLPSSSLPEPVPVTLHGISTQATSSPPIFFYTIPGTLETENWLN